MSKTAPKKPFTPELTLAETRELLADLYHEIDNRGGSRESELFANAYYALHDLVCAYLSAEDAE